MKTIKDIQKITKEWVNQKGFKWTSYAEYCHLVEEIGELGEALTVQHGERQAGSGSQGHADHSDMDEEIGDVLFSTIVMANRYNIDIEKCFNNTIKRYDKKIKEREKNENK